MKQKTRGLILAATMIRPLVHREKMRKLLAMLGWTNFHFLNDGCARMLFSFLHRDELTCFSTTRLFNGL